MTQDTRTPLTAEYAAANPGSQRLRERQAQVVPLGVTHTARLFNPFPLFITQCSGSRKWDVDGHEYVDFWMGHGTFLLGHGHPVVNRAIEEQLARGLHAGGETETAVEWAEAICRLVPSAQAVRFTSSGGEATQLAMRAARAFTGKRKVIKFRHHFHGWHDGVATGLTPPWDLPLSAGVSPGALGDTLLLPGNEIAAVRGAIEADPEIAGVILEPGGGFSDTIPTDLEFLRELRELTAERDLMLIFDEVVTGFRYAPGGVQEWTGIVPDLTTLGKVIGGGLPAGAVAGRADIMEVFGTTGDAERDRVERMPHFGTWNAMPIVAAAGVATLEVISSGEPSRLAADRADQLRRGLNERFTELGLPATAYGRSSIWKTYLGEPLKLLEGDYSDAQAESEKLAVGWGLVGDQLRQAMLLQGIDVMRAAGFTSSIHTDVEIERTVDAFDSAVRRLRDEGLLTV